MKKQSVKNLGDQVKKLQSELTLIKQLKGIDEYIDIKVQKKESYFHRIRKDGPDKGIGKYLMIVDVFAKKETVYIPISIASSKKTTGFVYQIEGTAEGLISTAQVSCGGEGITQVTLGTILYAKIPVGKTASFRIQVEIQGAIRNTYAIVINRVNYKLSPQEARYRKFLKEIRSETLTFD